LLIAESCSGTVVAGKIPLRLTSPREHRGWDHAGQADELFGVLRFVVDQDFIVHMGSGTAAGAAEKTDLLMLGDPLPDRDDIAVKMGVKGGDAVSVIDLDHLAIVADIAGVGHDPRRGGMNRGHVGRRQIDPGVERRPAIERIVARAEPALELVIIERHRQRQRFHQAAELFHLVRRHRVRRIGFWRRHKRTALAAALAAVLGGQLRKQAVDIQTGRGEQAPNFRDGLASKVCNAARLVFRFRRRIGN